MKNGKGSKPRPYTDYNKYSSNWDNINFGMKENVWEEKTKNKKLTDLTEQEFETLKKIGFLWKFFPEATGEYREDCFKK